MTAKEYLLSIGRMKRIIAAKEEKIRALMEIATNTSQALTGMPHNPSGSKSPMADAICKKIDLEREVEEIRAKRNAAIEYLNSLPDTEETVILIKRYVRELTWEDISADMFMSRISVLKKHAKAVENFKVPENVY